MTDPSSSPGPLKVLTVCTHNRTRSVMTAAMLQSALDHGLGGGAALVRSAGFGPPDMPPIDDAVSAMDKRGLDVSGHRSRRVTAEIVAGADLVLAAERDHVVQIATMERSVFARTMTLPEFLELASAAPRGTGGLAEWAGSLTADRTPGDYLRADVPEIFDPTGSAPRIFDASVQEMEGWCNEAARFIVANAAG